MTGSDVAIKGDPADEHEDDFEDAHHDPASGSQSPVAADSANKSSLPMQKRRRVTRACDECRRKKIKCDGKQPCTHCTVYSYDCTYDQPSNRRRNPVPAYVEALEARVHRAEGLIQMIAPNLDLNDPALDIAVRHGYIPGLKSAVPGQHENPTTPSSRPPHSQPDDLSADKNETNLESMIRAVGLLDMDENGNWDYHGHSSGLSFVRRMREQLGDLMGPDTGTTPFIKSRPVSNVLDSPKSASIESPVDPLNPTSDLPPEHQARDLCAFAINMSSVVLRVVHVPSFWSSLGRIYSLPAHQFTNDDHKFFPLLYAVLAVGCVYGSNDDATYDTAIDRGFRYFKIARQMMDIADIRDMTSIQAVLFMILFLQCSARLSQCYSYIGVALRAAVRMGLHRSLPQKRFNPLELEMRKRVFWTIRKLDVYVGAMLGLPHTLTEDDIDQEDPVEVDDEHITETGITPMPPGTVTLMTAFNYHRRLLTILNKIVREVYPIHVRNSGPAAKSYTVSFSTIKDIEQQMEEWKASLPQGLDPSHDDPKLFRLQAALRVTYAFNQVLLYRPFLHFVGRSKRSEHSDQRAYACAASYINVSRNLIHICDQTNRRGSLGSSLWFTVYLTFFSILSLVYFAAENPDNETTQDIIKDALHGKAILSSAARRSMSADRCAATLDIIFKSLPQWIREGRQNPNPAPPKRKRKQVTEPRPSLVTQSAATPRALPPNIKLDPSATQSPATVMAGLSQVGVANDGQYTPQNAGFGAFTPTDYSPTTQTLQRFGLQQPSGNLDVQDLSSMMFSSAEPFTYPNQPLTTFEENNRNARGSQFYGTGRDSDLISMNGTGTPNSATVDGLEAQLYNGAPFALPGVNWPSDMQNMQHGSMGTQAHQQQQQHQQPLPQYQHPQYVVSQPPAMSLNWQQQRYPTQENERQVFQENLLQNIFGSEWSGNMMTQNYGPE